MEDKCFVVPPGGGVIWDMEPGRCAALKLLGGQTAESVMLFEETAPPGTATDFHLHQDSDEVAYVLSGEITFLIGDKVTVGRPVAAPSCPAPSRTPGRAPVLKQAASYSFTLRQGPESSSRRAWGTR